MNAVPAGRSAMGPAQPDAAEAFADYQAAEAANRHDAVIFLMLFAIIGLDLFAIEDEQQRQRATAVWLAWGLAFLLAGFFLIAPEQSALQRARRRAQRQRQA